MQTVDSVADMGVMVGMIDVGTGQTHDHNNRSDRNGNRPEPMLSTWDRWNIWISLHLNESSLDYDVYEVGNASGVSLLDVLR